MTTARLSGTRTNALRRPPSAPYAASRVTPPRRLRLPALRRIDVAPRARILEPELETIELIDARLYLTVRRRRCLVHSDRRAHLPRNAPLKRRHGGDGRRHVVRLRLSRARPAAAARGRFREAASTATRTHRTSLRARIAAPSSSACSAAAPESPTTCSRTPSRPARRAPSRHRQPDRRTSRTAESTNASDSGDSAIARRITRRVARLYVSPGRSVRNGTPGSSGRCRRTRTPCSGR